MFHHHAVNKVRVKIGLLEAEREALADLGAALGEEGCRVLVEPRVLGVGVQQCIEIVCVVGV